MDACSTECVGMEDYKLGGWSFPEDMSEVISILVLLHHRHHHTTATPLNHRQVKAKYDAYKALADEA